MKYYLTLILLTIGIGLFAQCDSIYVVGFNTNAPPYAYCPCDECKPNTNKSKQSTMKTHVKITRSESGVLVEYLDDNSDLLKSRVIPSDWDSQVCVESFTSEQRFRYMKLHDQFIINNFQDGTVKVLVKNLL